MSASEEYKSKYPLLFEENTDLSAFISDRLKLAWDNARIASLLLKDVYGADKVIVFGSMISSTDFDENSDIDLAVSGIPDEKFYSAVGAVTRIIQGYKVDVVDLNECSAYMRNEILKAGIEI